MAVECVYPETIRDEDHWQSVHGRRGRAHVRVCPTLRAEYEGR